MQSSYDREVRAAAFAYVDELTNDGTDTITWSALQAFEHAGRRIPLASQQGIFKPALLELPISIRTTPRPEGAPRPYEDEVTPDGYLRYMYRGTDPGHRDNRQLRAAMDAAVPVLYLDGIAKGVYQASGAVVIAADNAVLAFTVALMPLLSVAVGANVVDLPTTQRRYYLATVRQRVRQAEFRRGVLRAYRTQCAMCRLRRAPLLDAAHIRPDQLGGEPVVSNGLSLCKIHHAAYDADLVGVRPDLVAEVRADVLSEEDGPMLQHGLQGMHGQPLIVPRRPSWRPDAEAVEMRYERFRAAS